MSYRVLIIQTAYLGDVILTLPLVDELRKNLYASAEIHFLAIPAVANVLENYPGLDKVILYDKRKKERSLRAFFKKVLWLRKTKYDLVLLPHRSWRSALLARWAHIPVRIGFDKSWAAFLYTQIVSYEKKEHEVNRNLRLLQPLGILVPKESGLHLQIDESDRQTVETLWRSSGLKKEAACVAVAPGSVWFTKRWLPDRFAQLVRELLKEGVQIVVVGGPEDADLGRLLQEVAPSRVANFVGKLTPRQSAEAIRRCDVLVANDSAPVHLASAVGTRVVEIFGPTLPSFGFTPFGVPHRLVENKTLACRPCGEHGGSRCPLGTFDCMKSISVVEVLRATEELLNA